MVSRNGRVAWTADEIKANPNLQIMLAGGRIKQAPADVVAANPELDGLFFLLSFLDSDPWFEFITIAAPPKPVYPPRFLEVYGARPLGEDNITKGLQVFWDQQLGFWYDDQPPDWATPIMRATAAEYFAAHGMGRLAPYRLKVPNGDLAEFVAFPESDKRAMDVTQRKLPLCFEHKAELVYRLMQQGVAIYQWYLKQAEVDVPVDQQVDFFGGPRITHLG